MLGRRKDAQFAMALARYSFRFQFVTVDLRATRIIRELKYAKLRAHKSMHIVILWRESVNGSTLDQKKVF